MKDLKVEPSLEKRFKPASRQDALVERIRQDSRESKRVSQTSSMAVREKLNQTEIKVPPKI